MRVKDADRPPLKPLVFQILLALSAGERHGWSLVREIQQRGEFGRLMPGNFYRTLRGLLADGLIETAPADGVIEVRRHESDDERRRYFRLTRSGRDAAAAEARRLEALVLESRSRRLLSTKGRS